MNSSWYRPDPNNSRAKSLTKKAGTLWSPFAAQRARQHSSQNPIPRAVFVAVPSVQPSPARRLHNARADAALAFRRSSLGEAGRARGAPATSNPPLGAPNSGALLTRLAPVVGGSRRAGCSRWAWLSTTCQCRRTCWTAPSPTPSRPSSRGSSWTR